MARYNGLPDKRVEEVLDGVGLLKRGGHKYRTYSLGMKQRLGIASALLKDPDLLVLDEPTNGLDPEGMAEIRALIRQFGQGDRTVILSSHLLGEVQQVSDRVGVMAKGRMLREGTTADLRGGKGLIVRASPVDLAVQAAAAIEGVSGVTNDNGAIRIAVDPALAGKVNQRLVAAGVEVFEISQFQSSLEEVFLQLTQSKEAR